MNSPKLNPAQYERRKMFESRNYRQKVKKMIELQEMYRGRKLTKDEKEIAKYFAEPLNLPAKQDNN
jgi:hypothetical protein